MYCLARYERCASAAITAAGRVRGRAAVNSAHHARQLLTAFDALAPWRGAEDEPEPEEVQELGIVADSETNMRLRTQQQRDADILDAVQPGEWIPASEVCRRARLGRTNTNYHADRLVAAGLLQRRQVGKRIVEYARA